MKPDECIFQCYLEALIQAAEIKKQWQKAQEKKEAKVYD